MAPRPPLACWQLWAVQARTWRRTLSDTCACAASSTTPCPQKPCCIWRTVMRLPLLRTRETATVSRSREAASGEGVEREFFDLFGRVVLQPGRALVQHRRAALRDFGHGSNDPGAAERLLTCLGEWALGSEGLSLVESSAESGLLTPAIYHLDQEKPQPWVVQAGRAYRLVGKYLAQALLQKQATPLCWAPHVLRLVFDLPLRVADYAAWQPEHHRQLVQLLAAAARGEPVEEWDLTFDVDVRAGGMHAWGTAVTLSLDHSGVVERAVTAHSAVEFVHELMLARMNLARPAALAMQAGVLEVLPRAKWTLLTDDVVASVTCPSTDITAAMLWPALEVRDGRDLVRFPDERPFAVFVEWLQSVVSTWSRTSCEQFVRFATGRSILAPDVLPIKVEVKPARAALPEAQTCFSIVRIPFYADAASLSEALTLVLAHSQGFGLE
ncbi:uncharacterized protein MONBRDRAFT_32170 [Monosiga brevicollis MX1]|uniref:HECT domain-containing protein n=1 Tax=Monosiga brevicollis TaxID=81824 RepID=A9UY33_MONBE|nr:uncharacterized protein MONBRDRAFT_32170 [Monosiga brevicollis MX1]EDQ89792.1 predicted protein [Monosiga brevicollis MX1]|eukprot:XP_001745214.1 hypothetical protein [Monosiga brevicollis MX1]